MYVAMGDVLLCLIMLKFFFLLFSTWLYNNVKSQTFYCTRLIVNNVRWIFHYLWNDRDWRFSHRRFSSLKGTYPSCIITRGHEVISVLYRNATCWQGLKLVEVAPFGLSFQCVFLASRLLDNQAAASTPSKGSPAATRPKGSVIDLTEDDDDVQGKFKLTSLLHG